MLLVVACFLPQIAFASASPEWTRTRLFRSGQVYIVPEMSGRLEYHLQDAWLLDGTGINTIRSDISGVLALPGRVQFEARLGTQQNGLIAPLTLQRESVRLSWAWAQWHRFWGNPVVSLGLTRGSNAAPKAALRVTLGDALGDTWRVYTALQVSREIANFARANDYELRGGLAWQSPATPVGWAVDAKVGMRDQAGSRLHASAWQVRFDPTVIWEASESLYVVGVFGVSLDAERSNGTTTHSWSLVPSGYIAYRF